MVVTAADDIQSANCYLRVTVQFTQLVLQPPAVHIDTESTSFGEGYFFVRNMGQTAEAVSNVNVNHAWVTIAALLDDRGVAAVLPIVLQPNEYLRVNLRGVGTSVEPGTYATNATVRYGNIGDTASLVVSMSVVDAQLRVIALPSSLPDTEMRAGERGAQTALTLYNVDEASLTWEVGNCTRSAVALSQPDGVAPIVSFSMCQNVGSKPLERADSERRVVSLVAPTRIGEYIGSHSIYAQLAYPLQSELAEWKVESTLRVIAGTVLPSRCTAEVTASRSVAGEAIDVAVTPKDQYENAVTYFDTLNYPDLDARFVGTVATSTSGEHLADVFTSAWIRRELNDGTLGPHQCIIRLQLSTVGAYEVPVWMAGVGDNAEGLPDEAEDEGSESGSWMDDNQIRNFYFDVVPVTCNMMSEGALVSEPNEQGNECVCRAGFARLATGECARCGSGSRPRENREDGCEKCKFYPGTISSDGLACVQCPVGLRPSTPDYSECLPCPDSQYFAVDTLVCKACEPGMELDLTGEELDRRPNQAVPCVPCLEGFAGNVGTCDRCDDGYMPNEATVCSGNSSCVASAPSIRCDKCPMGQAGERGICEECPPGRHQNSYQTSCLDCSPGTFRGPVVGGNWDMPTCAECPDGMVSDVRSERPSDCRCGEGSYDRLAAKWNENSDGSFEMEQDWSKLVSDPIICFKQGNAFGEALVVKEQENRNSYEDFRSHPRRCVKCPECVDCTAVAVDSAPLEEYRGRPTVKLGWNVLRSRLKQDAEVQVSQTPPFSGGSGQESVLTVLEAPRHIFGCPFDNKLSNAMRTSLEEGSGMEAIVDGNEIFRSVCKAERLYANQSNYQGGELSHNPNITFCEEGFAGPLCSVCDEGYTRSSKEGCRPCADATENAMTGLIVIGAFFVLLCLKKCCKRSVFHKVEDYFRVGALVMPSLVGDIRVFISVYQTVGNMSATLSIQWPEEFEEFIEELRSYVSLDLFSLPSVGCLVTGNFYTKLWVQLGIPIIMELLIYIYYKTKYDKLHLGHIPDLERDNIAWSHLSRVHEMERKLKENKTKDWHSFGIFRQARRWDTAEEEKSLKDIKDNAFADEHENDYEHLLSLMTQVIDQAEASAAQVDSTIRDHLDKKVELDFEEQEKKDKINKKRGKKGKKAAADPEEGTGKYVATGLSKLSKEEIWRGEVGEWGSLADDVLGVLLDDSKTDPIKQKKELYKILGNYRFSEEKFKEFKTCATDIKRSKQMKKRYKRLAKKAELEQTVFGWAFFVVFLMYPSVTNRIFATFSCYEIDEDNAFMEADYSVPCTDSTYYFHETMCYTLVFIIPLGIPITLGRTIWKARKDIADHKGPHHLENLYKDYKTDCALWEIYQMVQKVILVGLLTFIQRGSILQCLVGLIVANIVLILMIRDRPYLDFQTNVLAIMGQGIVVMSYLSALLMRVDLETEGAWVNQIGTVLIALNVPMMVYLAYDTYVKMQVEFYAAQIDMLAQELGGMGAKYRCIKEVKVLGRRPPTHYAKKKQQRPEPIVLGVITVGEIVTAEDQMISKRGVAKIKIDRGWGTAGGVWCKFNHVGHSATSVMTGERNFELLHTVKAKVTGKLEVVIRRVERTVVVTVMSCKGLKDMDHFGKNDVFVKVRINDRDDKEQKSTTLFNSGANAIWGMGKGENLVFENTPQLEQVDFSVYDEDDDGTNELIGLTKAPSTVIELDCNYGRDVVSAEATKEREELREQMHDMEEQKRHKDKAWETLAHDQYGEGDWHWHSKPLLTIREDIGDKKYIEDDDGWMAKHKKGGGVGDDESDEESGGKKKKEFKPNQRKGKKGKRKPTPRDKHGRPIKQRSRSRPGSRSSKSGKEQEEDNPLHGKDEDAPPPPPPKKKKGHFQDSKGAKDLRSKDFDAGRSRDFDTGPTEDFANPMADGEPVNGSRPSAEAPPTTAPKPPPKKKKMSRSDKKAEKKKTKKGQEKDLMDDSFDANPLAEDEPEEEEVAAPSPTLAGPAAGTAPPPVVPKKKKKKKGGAPVSAEIAPTVSETVAPDDEHEGPDLDIENPISPPPPPPPSKKKKKSAKSLVPAEGTPPKPPAKKKKKSKKSKAKEPNAFDEVMNPMSFVEEDDGDDAR
jgi:hypothetical protein